MPSDAPLTWTDLSAILDKARRDPLVARSKALGGNPNTKGEAVVFLVGLLWGKLVGVPA